MAMEPETSWVPLADAPFRLRFGDDLVEEHDGEPELAKAFGWAPGSIWVSRVASGLYIECLNIDDGSVGARFRMSIPAYLGGAPIDDAIITWERTWRAIELGVRRAAARGQIKVFGRKTDVLEPFVPIPAAALRELTVTNWARGQAESKAGTRVFDMHVAVPAAVLAADPAAAKTAKAGRPRGSGYKDALLVLEMRGLVKREEARSPTEAASMVVHKARGAGTRDSKIRRLVSRYCDKLS
jgi:hypothetical protein